MLKMWVNYKAAKKTWPKVISYIGMMTVVSIKSTQKHVHIFSSGAMTIPFPNTFCNRKASTKKFSAVDQVK